MRKSIYFIGFLMILALTSCQDVIDIDLKEGEKQLVVEANIDWKVQTSGNRQQIILTHTMPFFYEEQPPKISGAVIWIIDENGNQFDFHESLDPKGVYENLNFSPSIGMKYTLYIEYNGQRYSASDVMNSVPSEVRLVQKNDGGLFGKDMELRGYFEDDPDKTNNFYIIRIDNKRYKKPAYITMDGKLFKDNRMFFIYSAQELQQKDTLKIRIYSVTSSYYDYFSQLLGISQGGSGKGPFSTPPATIRGNIVDKNNHNKNPLGAFRTTQYNEIDYILE